MDAKLTQQAFLTQENMRLFAAFVILKHITNQEIFAALTDNSMTMVFVIIF